jgi:glycosyltransferase involved in cell wall biosynthesis
MELSSDCRSAHRSISSSEIFVSSWAFSWEFDFYHNARKFGMRKMDVKGATTQSIEVSFVIPALNAERTIRNTLQSIYAQKYPAAKFEVLVIDNGSTDRTREIASSVGAKILRCRKTGPAAARNYGAKRAMGRFIAFVDADVYLDPLWLKSLLVPLKSVPFGIALSRVVPVGERTFLNSFRQKLGEVRYHGTNISVFNEDGTVGPAVNTAACIYRKALFTKLGGFDENLLRAEDTELSNRLFLQGVSIYASASALAFVRYEYGPVRYLVRQFKIGNGLQVLQKHKYGLVGSAASPFPNLIRETRSMSGSHRLYYSCGLLLRYFGARAPIKAPKRRFSNYYFPELELLLTRGFVFKIKNRRYSLGAQYRAISVDKKMYFLSKQGKVCGSTNLSKPSPHVVKRMVTNGVIVPHIE